MIKKRQNELETRSLVEHNVVPHDIFIRKIDFVYDDQMKKKEKDTNYTGRFASDNFRQNVKRLFFPVGGGKSLWIPKWLCETLTH